MTADEARSFVEAIRKGVKGCCFSSPGFARGFADEHTLGVYLTPKSDAEKFEMAIDLSTGTEIAHVVHYVDDIPMSNRSHVEVYRLYKNPYRQVFNLHLFSDASPRYYTRCMEKNIESAIKYLQETIDAYNTYFEKESK